ncbi:hypothetical protein [Actinoplanes sp. NPDC049599]|uniref:hypothetical protein n=1 Tax=Actinoplanes sp. NPDC049599 TaxID=3363903 RepID=UPI0037946926
MTTQSESDQPNEFGFAGGGTAPQPEPDPADRAEAERVAVPSDDLTGSISDGINRATHGDDTDR